MKNLFFILLACVAIFAFASCDENTSVDKDDEGAGENVVEDIGEDSVEGIIENKPVEKNYPDNFLADPFGQGSAVFNNWDVRNESIRTVTFLDTLADMPADAWDASKDLDKSVMAWITDNGDLYIAGEGGVTASNCKGMFMNYRNATSINFNGCFYTDLEDRIIEMFMYCEKLETLDLSGWNTSNMRYMNAAFRDCFSLKSINLSGWDTSNVETMSMMFEGCQYLENVDVSHFDTSKVVNFSEMFSYCKRLKSLDLSNWDTSSAKSMSEMFYNCKEISTIGNFKVPEGCDTTDMFEQTPLA